MIKAKRFPFFIPKFSSVNQNTGFLFLSFSPNQKAFLTNPRLQRLQTWILRKLLPKGTRTMKTTEMKPSQGRDGENHGLTRQVHGFFPLEAGEGGHLLGKGKECHLYLLWTLASKYSTYSTEQARGPSHQKMEFSTQEESPQNHTMKLLESKQGSRLQPDQPEGWYLRKHGGRR